MSVVTKVIDFWQSLPPSIQRWLKGAEVAVGTAIIVGCTGVPFSDFTTKHGILKFLASVAVLAYGGLRLYLAQSPLPTLIKQTVESQTLTIGDISKTTTSTETTTASAPTAVNAGSVDVASANK
jgi:hypothetical protein